MSDSKHDVEFATCCYPRCTRAALFGPVGGQADSCLWHCTGAWIVCMPEPRPLCQHCSVRASFGLPRDGIPVRCASHAKSEDASCVFNRCVECNAPATHGKPLTRGTHCLTHKAPDMVDAMVMLCMDPTCKPRALAEYAPPGRRAERCKDHRKFFDQRVAAPQCMHQSCRRPATHGTVYGHASYCQTHASPDMRRKCATPGCVRLAANFSDACTVHDRAGNVPSDWTPKDVVKWLRQHIIGLSCKSFRNYATVRVAGTPAGSGTVALCLMDELPNNASAYTHVALLPQRVQRRQDMLPMLQHVLQYVQQALTGQAVPTSVDLRID